MIIVDDIVLLFTLHFHSSLCIYINKLVLVAYLQEVGTEARLAEALPLW